MAAGEEDTDSTPLAETESTINEAMGPATRRSGARSPHGKQHSLFSIIIFRRDLYGYGLPGPAALYFEMDGENKHRADKYDQSQAGNIRNRMSNDDCAYDISSHQEFEAKHHRLPDLPAEVAVQIVSMLFRQLTCGTYGCPNCPDYDDHDTDRFDDVPRRTDDFRKHGQYGSPT